LLLIVQFALTLILPRQF